MPPDGYSTVTLDDEVMSKLARILVQGDRDSYSEAIELAVDEFLARDGQLSDPELVQMLSDRLN